MQTYATVAAQVPPYNPKWAVGKTFPTKPVVVPPVKKTQTVETTPPPAYEEKWRNPFFQKNK